MSCHGCDRALEFNNSKNLDSKSAKLDLLKIAPNFSDIFDWSPQFVYKSNLIISLNRGDDRQVSHEVIEIVGDNQKVLLKKKIDDHHFFEVFKNGDEFFVKSRLGKFRDGKSNKRMYRKILSDGLNMIPWVLDGFSLYEHLMPDSDDHAPKLVYRVKNMPVSQRSPFMIDLRKRAPMFHELKGSNIFGVIEFDKNSKLPMYARFEIKLFGVEDQWIKLDVDVDLTNKQVGKALEPPTLSGEEPIQYPVNIAPRFIELFNEGLGAK